VADVVVADTDVVIDFLRGAEPGASLVRSLLKEGRLRFTPVTAYELRRGADFVPRDELLMRLLARRTYPLDLEAALRAGAVAAELKSQGREIGAADALQAGFCLRHDVPLATRNRRHFDRVDGLRLVDL
jgi:tRNA(fMet)-specific endonuclease VapC